MNGEKHNDSPLTAEDLWAPVTVSAEHEATERRVEDLDVIETDIDM